MIWIAMGLLAAGTYLLKAIGPIGAAGRQLPSHLTTLANLLPAALLAALVATQTFGEGTSLTFDARAVGVGVAAVAVLLRAPFALVVLVGALATAGSRMLGWG